MGGLPVLFQVVVEIIHDLPEQVVPRVPAIDTVVTVGIHVHLEILIGLYQRLGIFKRVLRMNIIVSQSVTDQ